MTDKLRKIILIILAVLVLAVLVFFIFFYKATVNISVEPSNAQIDVEGKLAAGNTKVKLNPGIHRVKITSVGYIAFDQNITVKISQTTSMNIKLRSEPKPQALSQIPTSFLASSAENNALLFLSNEGKTIFKLDGVLNQDNKNKPYAITPDNFSDVRDIVWQPTKNLAIIKHTTTTSLYDFARYDLLHQESIDWGEGIKGISWRADGEKILYYFAPQSGEKSLIRANKDNSGKERILDLRNYSFSNPKVYWAPNQTNAIIVEGKIYLVDVITNTIKELKDVNEVSDAGFTPDGKIIYEKNNGLFTIDLENNITDLAIKSRISQIAWMDQKNFIYAASNKNTDDFNKFNLDSKEITGYAKDDSVNIDAQNMIVSSDKNQLFFTSGNNLYSLTLTSKKY